MVGCSDFYYISLLDGTACCCLIPQMEQKMVEKVVSGFSSEWFTIKQLQVNWKKSSSN